MTAAPPRVALVTGANRGLGLETCRQLLGRGLRVAMTGRDVEATERARRGLGDLGQGAIAVGMDVTDSASIADTQRAVHERLGAVDVLVNNAAVLLHENDDVLSIPADGFRRSLETNLLGAIEAASSRTGVRSRGES